MAQTPRKEPICLLLVEDHAATADLVAQGMRRRDYVVDVAGSTRAARARLAEHHYDLVLLDVALPGESGLTLCSELRQAGQIPVIVISGHDRLSERVAAFDAGADDFVSKPFHVVEVCARVEAVTRRAGRRDPSQVRRGPHGLQLNVAGGEVRVGDLRRRLTRSEGVLLRVLMDRAGETVTSDELAREVWNYEASGDANFIQQHVSRLRRKLKQLGLPDVIETVYGVGYQMTGTDPADPAASAEESRTA